METADDVRAVSDPLARARLAGTLMDGHEQARLDLAEVRREAVKELVRGGMTHTELAPLLSITTGRISQIINTGLPPERAMLSPTRSLVVALGGKVERKRAKAGPVVSHDDVVAYDLLRTAAEDMGLAVSFEVINGGRVDLGRSSLVAICGPRLSSVLRRRLESDPHLGFAEDERGWHMVDRTAGIVLRSPMDDGEHADYAYLGRLPCVGTNGTYLYVAGVHAPGCAGAVHYLVNNLAKLYEQVKRGLFSVAVHCEFDPHTREVTSSRAVGPIYLREA